jgi:hypothetical protein
VGSIILTLETSLQFNYYSLTLQQINYESKYGYRDDFLAQAYLELQFSRQQL